MKFVMAVDKVVGTVYGHAIDFKAGEPTHVPKECWKAVREQGAVPEDEIVVEKATATPVVKQVVTEEVADRKPAVFAAFKKLVEENKRGTFTAAGVPTDKVMEKLLGFELHAKERDALWVEFKQEHKL